ncbi:MAG: sugar transferase [Bacteroidia bacterium]|nr:sugar transferase [Bacteroidia bacterium]
MIKRTFDFTVALLLTIILLPLFIVIAIMIKRDSKGPVFFIQQRVGKNNKDFGILKFRTMFTDAEQKGSLTVGKDKRITRTGRFLRKFKLDELPQLFNVMKGDMSLVGPRPEVKKYVELYNEEQKKVLSVKPGITDTASIQFADENMLLAGCDDPEKKYITEIMPAKLKLNLQYINQQSFLIDLKILLQTFSKVFLKKR